MVRSISRACLQCGTPETCSKILPKTPGTAPSCHLLCHATAWSTRSASSVVRAWWSRKTRGQKNTRAPVGTNARTQAYSAAGLAFGSRKTHKHRTCGSAHARACVGESTSSTERDARETRGVNSPLDCPAAFAYSLGCRACHQASACPALPHPRHRLPRAPRHLPVPSYPLPNKH